MRALCFMAGTWLVMYLPGKLPFRMQQWILDSINSQPLLSSSTLLCPLASHFRGDHSEPRSEHAGSFFLCRALSVLGSGLPLWLHIGITWEPSKSLMLKGHPKPIKLESLRRNQVSVFLTLPRWFQWAWGLENRCKPLISTWPAFLPDKLQAVEMEMPPHPLPFFLFCRIEVVIPETNTMQNNKHGLAVQFPIHVVLSRSF